MGFGESLFRCHFCCLIIFRWLEHCVTMLVEPPPESAKRVGIQGVNPRRLPISDLPGEDGVGILRVLLQTLGQASPSDMPFVLRTSRASQSVGGSLLGQPGIEASGVWFCCLSSGCVSFWPVFLKPFEQGFHGAPMFGVAQSSWTRSSASFNRSGHGR